MMAALGSAHEAASLRGQRQAEGAAVLGMNGPADEPLGVELAQERGKDAMMVALGSAHDAESLQGQHHAEGATVLAMNGPADETLGVEPVYDAGEIARRDQEPARELDEREAVRLAVELV